MGRIPSGKHLIHLKIALRQGSGSVYSPKDINKVNMGLTCAYFEQNISFSVPLATVYLQGAVAHNK